MGKLVYQEPQDFFVQISVCSLNSFIVRNPFSVLINQVNRGKINSVLENSIGSNFILFPEYTYNTELQEIYQNYCNQNDCIIIGGSGLEPIGHSFYAYSPIFIPNQEVSKVYKKHITYDETVYSGGRIIGYPNEVQRQIRINGADNDIKFSVYICYDFLIENKLERDDIIFVPQYEHSPLQFMNEGDRISKGFKNFVIGANNANNNQRNLGFAILNSQLITALTAMGWRLGNYLDAEANRLDFHHTIFYDTKGELVLKFRINIGRPYSLPYTYNLGDNQPILIPLSNTAI